MVHKTSGCLRNPSNVFASRKRDLAHRKRVLSPRSKNPGVEESSNLENRVVDSGKLSRLPAGGSENGGDISC